MALVHNRRARTASSSGSGSLLWIGYWAWRQRPISALSSTGLSEPLKGLLVPPLGFGGSDPPSSGVSAAILTIRLPQTLHSVHCFVATTLSRWFGFSGTIYIG
jgi:hypothetical protein